MEQERDMRRTDHRGAPHLPLHLGAPEPARRREAVAQSQGYLRCCLRIIGAISLARVRRCVCVAPEQRDRHRRAREGREVRRPRGSGTAEAAHVHTSVQGARVSDGEAFEAKTW